MERNFMFNFVISDLLFKDSAQYPTNEISVQLTFLNANLDITSSRINVKDFQEGRSYDFTSTQQELKLKLSNSPLNLIIKKLGIVLSNITIDWDLNLFDKLDEESFNAYTQWEQKEINFNGEKIGTITMFLKLYCKCCQESSINDGLFNVHTEMQKVADPNDVLFLIDDANGMDNDKNILTECGCDKPCAGFRDIGNYQMFRGKVFRNTEMFTPCGNLGCCEATGKDDNYMDVIEQIERKNQKKDCHNTNHCCQHSPQIQTETPCKLNRQIRPPLSPSPRQNCERRMSCGDDHDFENITSNSGKCPYCHECLLMDKISKRMTCPKCDYKPYYNDISDVLSEGNQNKKTKNQCTCANGKVCVHCRIRNMMNEIMGDCFCENIEQFKQKNCGDVIVQCQENGKKSLSNILKEYDTSNDVNESIPHLSSILEAIKAKYNNENFNERQKKKKISGKSCYKQHLSKKMVPAEVPVGDSCEKRKKKKNKPASLHCSYIQPKMITRSSNKTHNKCHRKEFGVPKHMGWLWNLNTDLVERGWKPGAIRLSIKNLMNHFLKDYPVDTLAVSKYKIPKQSDRKKQIECEDLQQKPTFMLKKIGEEYVIVMRPLKSIEELRCCPNPYLNTKPIKFRINKNPLTTQLIKQIKCELMRQGYKLCTCSFPIARCFCRSCDEKQDIQGEITRICQCKNYKNDLTKTFIYEESESSDSEFEMEFTPPAGLMKPNLVNRPNLACKETQYDAVDFEMKPLLGLVRKKFEKIPAFCKDFVKKCKQPKPVIEQKPNIKSPRGKGYAKSNVAPAPGGKGKGKPNVASKVASPRGKVKPNANKK